MLLCIGTPHDREGPAAWPYARQERDILTREDTKGQNGLVLAYAGDALSDPGAYFSSDPSSQLSGALRSASGSYQAMLTGDARKYWSNRCLLGVTSDVHPISRATLCPQVTEFFNFFDV